VPLPGPLLAQISPVSSKIYHETGQILALFGRQPALAPRISIAPSETANAILLVLAYLALFLSAQRLLGNRARRRTFVFVLLAAATAHVAIAAAVQIGETRLRGTFANPDHFGGYLEISLATAFGVLWAEVLLNAERARGSMDAGERVESRLLPLAGRIVAWAIIAVGIGLTQSRGAIAASLAATAFMLLLAMLHPRAHRRRVWRGALAVAAGLLFVGLIAGRVALLRFIASDAREFRGGTRLELWKTSLEAWKEFPWLGSGLGSFADAFRRVQPRELNFLVEQAHSDPLQLLVTAGVVGAGLGLLLYGSLLATLLRSWYRQRHREESAMVLAGIGALLSLTLHGLVEYNMSIPAIPATLACVLGMAVAAGATSTGARVD
jgi:O-antigen ligase